MILEHQSSNSTSEYQQGDDKVIPESMGNSNVLSEADFSVADIRRVRWLLKC
jgi:putative NADH-flavin reductase